MSGSLGVIRSVNDFALRGLVPGDSRPGSEAMIRVIEKLLKALPDWLADEALSFGNSGLDLSRQWKEAALNKRRDLRALLSRNLEALGSPYLEGTDDGQQLDYMMMSAYDLAAHPFSFPETYPGTAVIDSFFHTAHLMASFYLASRIRFKSITPAQRVALAGHVKEVSNACYDVADPLYALTLRSVPDRVLAYQVARLALPDRVDGLLYGADEAKRRSCDLMGQATLQHMVRYGYRHDGNSRAGALAGLRREGGNSGDFAPDDEEVIVALSHLFALFRPYIQSNVEGIRRRAEPGQEDAMTDMTMRQWMRQFARIIGQTDIENGLAPPPKKSLPEPKG